MKNFFFPLIPNFECRESFSFGAKSEGHDVIGSELDNSKPEEGKCEAEKWSRRILRLGNGTSALCPQHFFKGLLVGKCPNCCFFFFFSFLPLMLLLINLFFSVPRILIKVCLLNLLPRTRTFRFLTSWTDGCTQLPCSRKPFRYGMLGLPSVSLLEFE